MSALHRRDLHLHCHRLLGSFHEAEEAFLRAWRRSVPKPGDAACEPPALEGGAR